MATKTLYLTTSLSGGGTGYPLLSETAQSAATTATGWTVGTAAAGTTFAMKGGTETSSTTGAVDGSIDTANFDAIRAGPFSGTFASGNWTFNFALRAVTLGGAQDDRIQFRLFKSANADGSSATEITAAVQTCSTATDITTAADFASSLTLNPGAITLSNEYLFIQVGCNVVGAGGMTTADALLRTGSSGPAGTRIVTSDFTSATTGTLSATDSGNDSASISGTVDVSGSMSGTETGADSASISGTVAIRGTSAASEGTLWTPADLGSDLLAWFDASDASTIIYEANLGGTGISRWNDKSGNGRHAVSEFNWSWRSDDLTVSTDAAVSGNGRFFLGGISNTYPYLPATAWDVATVGKHDSGNSLWITLAGTGANDWPLWVDSAGDKVSVLSAGSSTQAGTLTWPGDALAQLYVSIPATADIQISRDGGALQTATGENMTRSAQPVMLIASSATPDDANEFVYTTSGLSQANREKLQGYLAHKWDRLLGVTTLVSALPSNHPYKLGPPLTGGQDSASISGSVPTTGTLAATETGADTASVTGLTLGGPMSAYEADDGVAPSVVFDSSDASTLTVLSGEVARWANQRNPAQSIGNSNGTGPRPAMGSPGVVFTPGAGEQLREPIALDELTSLPTGASPSTVVVVWQTSASGTQKFIRWGNSGSVGAARGVEIRGGNFGGNTNGLANLHVSGFSAIGTKIGAWRLGATTSTLNVDGSANDTFTLTGAVNTAAGGLVMGAWVDNEFFDGTIYELRIYPKELSDAQLRRVEGELAWKWNLVGNLPSGHPHKNAAPGADSASIAGTVATSVSGSLSATEAGADSASIAAAATVSGALGATESPGADAAAVAGAVAVAGTLSATEAAGQDAATATGTVLVSGALSAAEAAGQDAASFTAASAVAGTLSATDSGADSAAGSGAVAVSGAVAATEAGQDTASFTGSLESNDITGALSATETGNDSASITGGPTAAGGLSATETGEDTAAIAASAGAFGTLSSTETGQDTATITASAAAFGSLEAQESGEDTAAVSGGPIVAGAVAASEAGQDTADISGPGALDEVTGALSATETGQDSAQILESLPEPELPRGGPALFYRDKRTKRPAKPTLEEVLADLTEEASHGTAGVKPRTQVDLKVNKAAARRAATVAQDEPPEYPRSWEKISTGARPTITAAAVAPILQSGFRKIRQAEAEAIANDIIAEDTKRRRRRAAAMLLLH